jgi:hypothetical protein
LENKEKGRLRGWEMGYQGPSEWRGVLLDCWRIYRVIASAGQGTELQAGKSCPRFDGWHYRDTLGSFLPVILFFSLHHRYHPWERGNSVVHFSPRVMIKLFKPIPSLPRPCPYCDLGVEPQTSGIMTLRLGVTGAHAYLMNWRDTMGEVYAGVRLTTQLSFCSPLG